MYDLNRVPIGIYEKALPSSFSWEEKLTSAKEAGFDYLEISIDETDERLARLEWSKEEREKLKKLISATGVMIPSMCLSGHRRFPFGSKDGNTRSKALDIMKKAIELSADLGIRTIQLAAYDVYYEEEDEITKAFFIEGMEKSIAMASKAGVMLALEIMDTKFISTILRAMPYITKFNSPWFKIYPDLGNLSAWGSDVEAELELGLPHTVAIHVKETKPGVFKEVPFGEGIVKFAALFKKLKELNYQGPFLIEMWADNSKITTKEDAVRDIYNARIFVKEKMIEGGMVNAKRA
ncbi:L-ribulose-5-phosphate 3-epimerase [Clostridium estertheticum]|uniref:L-ribulose-5-phosphate 3-epimerase n=1 Tax=Clostridium estertheticum TaxID=238834 RepID=UPI001CF35CBE|nr:L-ribulose-5-phosphate 3-epimerase [Clostridium estertheticum]MCB2340614.1 L-ribulose-5-phosphate 3-epimerase [Clostridium estertheticum]